MRRGPEPAPLVIRAIYTAAQAQDLASWFGSLGRFGVGHSADT
jgi:hypothetical protein